MGIRQARRGKAPASWRTRLGTAERPQKARVWGALMGEGVKVGNAILQKGNFSRANGRLALPGRRLAARSPALWNRQRAGGCFTDELRRVAPRKINLIRKEIQRKELFAARRPQFTRETVCGFKDMGSIADTRIGLPVAGDGGAGGTYAAKRLGWVGYLGVGRGGLWSACERILGGFERRVPRGGGE